jgi:hypothetical protein
MKLAKICSIRAIAALCLLLKPAYAEMSEHLKHSLHTEKELGSYVLTDDSMSQLETLLKNPEIKILCAQMTAEQIDDAKAQMLLDWVRTGHSLWFYDAQLGNKFGFEPCFMTKEQFTNKPESGELGGRSVNGAATVAMNLCKHETLEGVLQVTVFLPAVKETYGAVWPKGDTVPLLKFKTDSPAVAALRREGKGLIVFKPLVWTEPLSGSRFQANLLEFSAGYQVPGPGLVGKVGTPPGPGAAYIEGNPAVPLPGVRENRKPESNPNPVETSQKAVVDQALDSLEFTDGTTLEGKVLNPFYKFETGNQSLQLVATSVRQFEMGGPVGLDRVTLADGKTKQGILILSSWKVEVKGQVRELDKHALKKVKFAKPSDKPTAPTT